MFKIFFYEDIIGLIDELEKNLNKNSSSYYIMDVLKRVVKGG